VLSRPRLTRPGNLTLQWSAGSVRAFGSAASSVVLPLVAVTTLQASAFDVGVLAASGTLPQLVFGLPAGVWVDLLSMRRLLVICDLARAVALVSIPVAAAFHSLTLAQLFVVASGTGTASVFTGIASQSFLPQIVPENKLLEANSKLQAGQNVAAFAGPGAGGWIVQASGAPLAVLLDAGSSLVSALCMRSIREPARPGNPGVRAPAARRLRQGVGYLWRSGTLRPLAIMAASFNMWGAAIGVLQVPFLVHTIHLKPAAVGVVMGLEAPAALLGAIVAGRLSARLGTTRTIAVAVIAGPCSALLMPLAWRGAGAVLFAAGACGLALFTVVSSIVTRVYRQRYVPADLLSRVTAVNRFLSWGVMPVGGLLAGALSVALGIRTAFVSIAIATAIVTPASFFLSPLREEGVPDVTAVGNSRCAALPE
jgi:MFS family permease